jgi:hypothetical protein
MPADLSANAKIVVVTVRRIARVLTLGGALCATAVMCRGFGRDEIEVLSVQIPVSLVWLPLTVGTFVHIFWTHFVVAAIGTQLASGNGDEARALFDEVRTSDSAILSNMLARSRMPRPGSRLVRMSYADPTTWIALMLVIGIVAAVVPWTVDNGLRFDGVANTLSFSAVAVALVMLNWWAGGLWAIGLSRLTTPAGYERFAPPMASSLGSPADISFMSLVLFSVSTAVVAAVLVLSLR